MQAHPEGMGGVCEVCGGWIVTAVVIREDYPRVLWSEVWHNDAGGNFSAQSRAEAFLEGAGFSVGRMQRGSPRGILFGYFDIQKWRNLNEVERHELHGEMTGDMRAGPVTVSMFCNVPDEGWAALQSALSPSESPK